jgi:hypothetical protein
MTPKYFLIPILLLLIVGVVSAVPNTLAVSDISNQQVTFNANGGAFPGLAWFEWGSHHDGYYYWSTINQTITAAAFSDTQYGTPLLTGQTYYVRACDETGCDLTDVSFAVPASDLPNRTSFGTGVYTMYRSGLNVTKIFPMIVRPYAQSSLSTPVVWMLLFTFIFIGLWVRPKDIFLPCILAFISSGIFIAAGTVGGLAIDQTFLDIGQGLMIAAIAGILVSWFIR